jgi:lipopolysaccharide transport system ATP-binding protein
MSQTAIKIENLSKQYRLGVVGTKTLRGDLQRFWWKVTGKGDPTLTVGQENVLADNKQLTAKSDNYVWALRDINLEVKKGEVLGIIGKNGAGKSTLLKILSRVTGPTTGSINVNGRIASLLEVGTGFHPELTGKENIFLNGAILGMRKHEIKKKLDEIVDFAGVARYINTPVKRYSSGMRVRLGFAVAAFLEPEILIVDEVLAVGDAEFQKKAIGKMQDVTKEEGRTVLFVSHNMVSVKNLCHKTILLENGKINKIGDTKSVIDFYLKNKIKQNFEKSGQIKNLPGIKMLR